MDKKLKEVVEHKDKIIKLLKDFCLHLADQLDEVEKELNKAKKAIS